MTLKEAMERKGMTAAALSRAAAVSEGCVSLILSGKRRGTLVTWRKFGAALGYDWRQLMPKGGE